MPSKVFVVCVATGQQGGAVVKLLTSDPVLSQEYTVRAVVRDPTKPAALALKDLPGCEIVQADLDDKASLYGAFQGAHSAFLVTNSIFDARLYEREYAQGQNAADVAVEAGLEYLIFSTLPSVRKISSDRYTKVWHFDVKYQIEQYIHGLPIASAFIAMGCFMQNLTNALKPRPVGDGTFEIATSMPSDTRYLQLPAMAFRTFLEEMNPTFAEDSMEMLGYYEDFGYFGPKTEELVQPSVVRDYGALTSVQEYVKELDF